MTHDFFEPPPSEEWLLKWAEIEDKHGPKNGIFAAGALADAEFIKNGKLCGENIGNEESEGGDRQ
jgi:hypothetical protein